jgi:hypothetical protein
MQTHCCDSPVEFPGVESAEIITRDFREEFIIPEDALIDKRLNKEFARAILSAACRERSTVPISPRAAARSSRPVGTRSLKRSQEKQLAHKD